MKPSIVFDRWLKKNADKIAAVGGAIQKQVAFVLLDLKMIEYNPRGMSPGMVAIITARMKTLGDMLAARKIAPPNIDVPKIKVIRPGPLKPPR